MRGQAYPSGDCRARTFPRRFSGHGYYDIAHLDPDPFPPEFFLGYLLDSGIRVTPLLRLSMVWQRRSFSDSVLQDCAVFRSAGYTDMVINGFYIDS